MSEFLYEIPVSQSWKISEPTPGYGETEYTHEEVANRLGKDEWFLAYTFNPDGRIEGLEENNTYSFSFLPGHIVQVRSYLLTKNKAKELLTRETESKMGRWKADHSLLKVELDEEILEFIIVEIEEGKATLMDIEDKTISVFMTEEALLEATLDILISEL